MAEFNNPFGALKGLRDSMPAAPASPQPVQPAKPSPPPGRTYPRAVVRMERAGRGGKEATVIEQLALSPSEREKWMKELRAALGCGGRVEGDTLMLQGDHRERLKPILESRGVKRVILG